MNAQVYTVAEVAELADVTPRTVRRHITSGRLPAVKAGRDYLVRARDAHGWVKDYARYDTLRMPRGPR